MTLSFSARQTPYYLLWTAAFLISGYLVYFNIDEVLKRLTGRTTLLSQMSWLTDRQTIIYSSLLTVVFASFMVVLGYRLYSKNKKGATIISIVTLTVAIMTVLGETLLYNKSI
jgi:lysylphosphatidylglycerol synthetase-like protein (DUF2156 family)